MTSDASAAPKRAVVLVADGFRDLEFWYPVLRLREADLEVEILSPAEGKTFRSELGYPVIADAELGTADGAHYDVVVVPGAAAGEALASNDDAVALVARSGARIITIGSGAAVATAAGVDAGHCEDADGLPVLFRELLSTMDRD